MHIDISACGEAPCWVYSNENVPGQFKNMLKRDSSECALRNNAIVLLIY